MACREAASLQSCWNGYVAAVVVVEDPLLPRCLQCSLVLTSANVFPCKPRSFWRSGVLRNTHRIRPRARDRLRAVRAADAGKSSGSRALASTGYYPPLLFRRGSERRKERPSCPMCLSTDVDHGHDECRVRRKQMRRLHSRTKCVAREAEGPERSHQMASPIVCLFCFCTPRSALSMASWRMRCWAAKPLYKRFALRQAREGERTGGCQQQLIYSTRGGSSRGMTRRLSRSLLLRVESKSVGMHDRSADKKRPAAPISDEPSTRSWLLPR